MNKKNRILLFLVLIVAIVVIVLLVKEAPDLEVPEETTIAPYEDYTYNTGPDVPETLEYIPYFTMPTEPEVYPETNVSSAVTIEQVPKDLNEVIDRNPVFGEPSDPEYLEDDEWNPFVSIEGKVYRNDKVITLKLSEDGTSSYEISFGAAFGTCNRFLYLNPSVSCGGKVSKDTYVCFETPMGGGVVHCFPNEAETEEPTTYTFGRALDDRNEAQYDSVQNPGAVWFAEISIDRPVYIDALIIDDVGWVIASVRLTIEKDPEDGTYSITDLDNNNLLVQNELYPKYTEDELKYITDMATETLFDSDLTLLYFSSSEEVVMNASNCIVDIRPEEVGLWYDEFIPVSGCARETSRYCNHGMDILSVTYGQNTFYYYIARIPTANEHGIYQYIGRDYTNYQTTEELIGSGWKWRE